MDVGVAGQKLFHPFGFVGGEIVQDAVNFPLSKLMGSQICKEGDKFFTAVPCSGFD